MIVLRTPVEPHTASRDELLPGDETALVGIPIFHVEGKIIGEVGGELAVLVTEGIGKEIEAGEVGAVRFLRCAKFHKIHDRRRGSSVGWACENPLRTGW